MQDLVPFDFEGIEVRTVIIDDAPWFVIRDVCMVLGIANGRDATSRLDSDGVGSTDVIDSMGRSQTASIVDESGLYELIFQSRKPEAKAFRRWVTGTVLPTIRKTGGYQAVPRFEIPKDLGSALRLAADEHDGRVAAEAKLLELEPKASFYDEVMDSNGLYSMEQFAKSIGFGRNVMMRQLRRLGILQGNNLPYQRYAHHFEVKPGTYKNRAGELMPTATTYVRPPAMDFLRNKLVGAALAAERFEVNA